MEEETLTLEDVLCMLDEVEPGQGRRGYKLLVSTLRQVAQSGLYRQIEQMAADAATDRTKIGWEREAVTHHQTLDRLLTLDTEALALELAAGIDTAATDFGTLLRICNVRRARGEGDDAKLAALEIELTASLQDQRTPGLRQAQHSLDLAIEQLISAFAESVGTQLAPVRASEQLIARAFRQLHTFAGVPESLAAE